MLNFPSPLKEEKSLWDILFASLLLSFFFLKTYFHGNTWICDLEEFFKVEHIFNPKNLWYFYPGQHGVGDFHGHPGFNNFLYFLFSKVFGTSLFTLRVFSLLCSSLFLASLYIFIAKTSGKFVGFFVAVSILVLPMFQIQSILFFNELPSLFFAMLSLIFLFRKNKFFFALCGSFSVLSLESSVAVYAVLFALASFKTLKKATADNVKWSLTCLIPIFVLIAFFFIENKETGRFSNHGTYDTVVDRFQTPNSTMEQGVVWESLFTTLSETIDFLSLWIFLGLFLFSIWWRRPQLKADPTLTLLGLSSVCYLIYFGFLSEFSGGRDYYFVFIFLFFFIFKTVAVFQRYALIPAILILGINGWFSYQQLLTPQLTLFQTNFAEYQQGEMYFEVANKMSKLDDTVLCHSFALGNLLCREEMGLKPANVVLVSDFEKPTFVIDGERGVEEFIQNHNELQVLEKVLLKEVPDNKFYALKVVKK